MVYADDFVACFKYKQEAECFYGHLRKRMGHFGLSLEEDKSRLIEFGPYDRKMWRNVERKRPHSIFWDLHTTVLKAGTEGSE